MVMFRQSRSYRFTLPPGLGLSLVVGLGLGVGLGTPRADEAPAPAAAAAPVVYNVRSGESTVTYHIVHKLHKVDGASKEVSGKALLLPNGQAKVQVQVKSTSFDSGNSNRDAHTKEVIGAAQFPIELKAACDGLALPKSFPATVERTCKAQLDFHGVQKAMPLPVTVTFESAKQARVKSSFQLSLDEFKVERPSLLLVKIDDALKLDVDVVFSAG